MAIEIPVPNGDLIDKITILEIKTARFADPAMLANARAELELLRRRRDALLPSGADLDALTQSLKTVNEQLWELEDTIREHERLGDFGAAFVAAARAIYRANDRRAALKRDINLATGSTLIEEKSYAPY